jgi:N-acyl-D-amino-acid deacylase
MQRPRGQIAAGFAADIVLFNPATILDCATYDAPTKPSIGIERVYVNGQLASLRSQTVNANAGRVLRRA